MKKLIDQPYLTYALYSEESGKRVKYICDLQGTDSHIRKHMRNIYLLLKRKESRRFIKSDFGNIHLRTQSIILCAVLQ